MALTAQEWQESISETLLEARTLHRIAVYIASVNDDTATKLTLIHKLFDERMDDAQSDVELLADLAVANAKKNEKAAKDAAKNAEIVKV